MVIFTTTGTTILEGSPQFLSMFEQPLHISLRDGGVLGQHFLSSSLPPFGSSPTAVTTWLAGE